MAFFVSEHGYVSAVSFLLIMFLLERVLEMLSENRSYAVDGYQTAVVEPFRELGLSENREEEISIAYPARYIFVLLVLLVEAHLCGSDIQKAIKNRFREKISTNSLYPLLHRMCDEDLIANLSEEPKMHYYRITMFGKKVLRRFCQEFKLVEKALLKLD
jgi:hypothetical protein